MCHITLGNDGEPAVAFKEARRWVDGRLDVGLIGRVVVVSPWFQVSRRTNITWKEGDRGFWYHTLELISRLSADQLGGLAGPRICDEIHGFIRVASGLRFAGCWFYANYSFRRPEL